MSRKKTFILFFILINIFAAAQDLKLNRDDLIVIQNPEGGYHLYIKAKPQIKSVLLTETTKDPESLLPNYAYRAKTYNKINGDEKRLLNGEFLSPEKQLYSLIDSTPENDTPLGRAFHIWIPYIIVYGYEWGQYGEIEVVDGTFFNIRTFAQAYGDYNGKFQDNPFVLRVTQKPVSENSKEMSYSADAEKLFSELSLATEGEMFYARNSDEIVPLIENILRNKKSDNLDLLFAIDATESMKNDISAVKKTIKEMLQKTLPDYISYRVALILYKDYREDFLVREACVFTDNLKKFERALYSFDVSGGRDIPEAVYEGLYLGLQQSWRENDINTDKKIILIGDAPPHPLPRGKITKQDVNALAAEKNVSIYSIILPHGLAY